VVANGECDAAADDVERTFEIDRIGDRGILADENLEDGGLVAARGLAEDLALHRDVAPAEEFLALLVDDVLEDALRGVALARLGGEKDETRSVIPLGGKLDTLLRHLLAEELV